VTYETPASVVAKSWTLAIFFQLHVFLGLLMLSAFKATAGSVFGQSAGLC
jgi:hypothetical protein